MHLDTSTAAILVVLAVALAAGVWRALEGWRRAAGLLWFSTPTSTCEVVPGARCDVCAPGARELALEQLADTRPRLRVLRGGRS